MKNSLRKGNCFYIGTSQLICTTNQLTGFYVRATLAFNGLKSLCLWNIMSTKFTEWLHQIHIYSKNVGACRLILLQIMFKNVILKTLIQLVRYSL